MGGGTAVQAGGSRISEVNRSRLAVVVYCGHVASSLGKL
jgi:hypothetical protein